MQIIEKIKPVGSVTVTVEDVTTGKIVSKLDKENLVVTTGRNMLARYLGGYAGQGAEFIDRVAFGTDGTAAIPSNTGLGNQSLIKDATVSYPADGQVKFTAVMEAVEGGTLTYREIGLLSAESGTLFSRLVIPAIEKSSIYKITVDWTISFQSAA